MARVLSDLERIEQSIHKKYRAELWAPFLTAIRQYDLIREGDRIAVCISGGKDSMLMAKMFQMLLKVTEIPFSVRYLVMDPGYDEEHRSLIGKNLDRLGIKADIRESPIFRITGGMEKSPCYLCARMCRGYLYRYAGELGCNKIALGHHLNDVIETTVMAMFYASQLQGMVPKAASRNFPGMELIRPMYRIRERDIAAFARYHGFTFLQCACPLTNGSAGTDGKRREIKELIAALKKSNPDIESSIFNSLHAVEVDTFPGWKSGGEKHSFTERYPSGRDQ